MGVWSTRVRKSRPC
ncbi:hypothetical protein F383_37454 [Gossypium arboreum]|uniref:Uncharacterized protein n=1 Tax=Gossypium arboreum TaxID=29729 RepID=A0A0B0M7Q5_GOSAR|nr:hypothetical protein F383_37454 [Gossypium arboreum]